jgi:hypothetical protein
MSIVKQTEYPNSLITKPTPDLIKAITDEEEPLDARNLQRLKDCLKILKSILNAQKTI